MAGQNLSNYNLIRKLSFLCVIEFTIGSIIATMMGCIPVCVCFVLTGADVWHFMAT